MSPKWEKIIFQLTTYKRLWRLCVLAWTSDSENPDLYYFFLYKFQKNTYTPFPPHLHDVIYECPLNNIYEIRQKVIAHSISLIFYSTCDMTSFGPLFLNSQLLVTYVQKLHKHLFHWISSIESMVVACVSRHRNTLACMVCFGFFVKLY